MGAELIVIGALVYLWITRGAWFAIKIILGLIGIAFAGVIVLLLSAI